MRDVATLALHQPTPLRVALSSHLISWCSTLKRFVDVALDRLLVSIVDVDQQPSLNDLREWNPSRVEATHR